MKETFKKIMRSGGYAVLIASIAMALYLFVINRADSFFKSKLVEFEIEVDDNGYLSTNYGGDKKDAYIIWETDAGTIMPVEKNETLVAQYEEGNKWYFAYTDVDEKVKWDNVDADGTEYDKATIRATVYSSESKETWYEIYDFINDAEITVTKKNKDNITLTTKADSRLFSNPVRKGTSSDWSQIYEVNVPNSERRTLRYRTGANLQDEKDLVLRWECNNAILNETDLKKGTLNNFQINTENAGKKVCGSELTITFTPQEKYGEILIEAYLTKSKNADKDYGVIPDEEKLFRTTKAYNYSK